MNRLAAKHRRAAYPVYKDSGVEWLGEIPEHWKILRLIAVGSMKKAIGGSKQDNVDNGIPCVRYGDLYTTYDVAIKTIHNFINSDIINNYTTIKYGDILMAASGETYEDIGKSAVNLVASEAYCGGDIIIFRPEKSLHPVFLAYALNSVSAQIQKARMGKGFTIVHIYIDQLRNLLTSIPPIAEQQTIATFLDRETSRIDELIAKVNRSIDLLREYRTTLISAAVTGKIDVREEVPVS